MWRLLSQLACWRPWKERIELLAAFPPSLCFTAGPPIGWTQSQRARELVDVVGTGEPYKAQGRVGCGLEEHIQMSKTVIQAGLLGWSVDPRAIWEWFVADL